MTDPAAVGLAERPRRPAATWPWLLAPLVLLAALYLGLALLLSRQLPARAVVAGVHVGGLDTAAAGQRLTARLDAATEPFTLVADDVAVRLRPEEVGLAVDTQATFGDATGFTLDPRRLWEHLTGSDEIPLRVHVDTAVAAPRLARFAESIDRPVEPGAVTFPGGRVEVVRPVTGRALHVAATIDRLERQWLRSRRIDAALTLTAPPVSGHAVDQAVERLADVAVAGDLVLLDGGARVVLAPSDFAPALLLAPVDGTLRLRVQAGPLAAALRRARPQVEGGQKCSDSGDLVAFRSYGDLSQDCPAGVIERRNQVRCHVLVPATVARATHALAV